MTQPQVIIFKMFKVIDNFFPAEVADKLQHMVITDNVVDLHDLPENVRQYQAVNTDMFQETKSYTRILMKKNVIEHEPSTELLALLLQNVANNIKVRFVVSSVRVNFMNPGCAEPTLKYDIPHIDIRDMGRNMYTLIYYVNNSHGDTILYREISRGSLYRDIPSMPTCAGRIPPRKNRMLIFDAGQVHSAPAYCAEDRYVINLNITTEFPLSLS